MVSSYNERGLHKSAVLSKTLNTILEQQRGFPNKRENHKVSINLVYFDSKLW